MKRGKALLSTSDHDRCIALTVMTSWKVAQKREERCPFMAKWVVDGKQFCAHHMRCESVAICIEGGRVKRLAAPPPITGQRVRVIKGKR